MLFLLRLVIQQSIAASSDGAPELIFFFFLNLSKIIVCVYMYMQKVQWDMTVFPYISCRVTPKPELVCLLPDRQALWPS